MTGFRPIDELMKVADVSRQPPHVLFAENAETTTRLSADALVNEMSLLVRSGNANHIGNGMYASVRSDNDDHLTEEEKREKKEREANARAMNTISASMAEYYNAYDGQFLSDINWAKGERDRIGEAIETEQQDRAKVVIKADDAQQRLEEAVAEEEVATTESEAAANREQNAENYDVLYDKDDNSYQAFKDENGNVLYYSTYDKDGNQIRLSPDEVDGLNLLSKKELAQDTVDTAEAAEVAKDNTAAIEAELAKYDAYIEYSQKFETVLAERYAEMETFIQEMEQQHQGFRDDFNAYKSGEISEADFLAKYPEKADRIEAYKNWQAQEESYKRDQEAFLRGDMTEEQLKNNYAEFIAKNERREQWVNDRTAVKNGEMSQEEFSEKYPSRNRSAARQDFQDKKDTLNDLRDAREALAEQRDRLTSDEVRQKIESGEMTFEQAAQAYSDPHFYNDFADRHGDLGLKKFEVTETAEAQTDTPWYQSMSGWLSGNSTPTQVADITPTANTNTSATALSSADGQGIKDTVGLKDSFNTSTTKDPIVTAEAAPVVAAQQQMQMRVMGLGA